MKREDEVKQAASQVFGESEEEKMRQAFVQGVEWADNNPGERLWNRFQAIEWLKSALQADVNRMYAEAFAKELCKYMEEKK
jgi:hypothetical protein